MSRRIALTTRKQMSEINLTPLMDLTFILLITFIITFPLIEQGIMVNLPKGKASSLTAEKAQSITVDRDGKLYLDDVSISFEDLHATMLQAGANNPDVSVMVRADETINYGSVVKVLKILSDARITKMALVTQEE